jgi:tetratricopeptide (TPR) repeat protein
VVCALACGAYVLYLRNLGHCPPNLRLRRKGLDALLAGQPVKAEQYFRKALSTVDEPDRVRALVSLSSALSDQCRYKESEECLDTALALGDPTGSGQGSMSDLLLLTAADPEKALELAEEALALTTGRSRKDIYFGGEVTNDFRQATFWARRAMALSQLGRQAEAQQAVNRATRFAEAAGNAALQTTPPHTSQALRLAVGGRRLALHRDLVVATAHWRIGLAFLALQDSTNAAVHFRMVRDRDRRGKYRRQAQKQLEQLKAQV